MTVPYTFGSATAPIPLSQLDSNFATAITLGNTAIQLGNTVTTLNNMTLANVTISSGTSNIAVTSIANGTSNVTIASSGGAVNIATNGTQALTIDTSQNVGIGTSSPSSYGGSAFVKTININSLNNISGGFSDGVTGTFRIAHASGQNIINFDASNLCFQSGGTGSPTERMRIDSSGNLLVGTTSAVLSGYFANFKASNNTMAIQRSGGTEGVCIAFVNQSGTATGSIYNYTASTNYNTSSDYRLKHDIQPMTGALAKVTALKPVTYKWNADDSDGEGFIAHELAEVCPHAVTGEKDAVYEDGSIKPQGIDTSFLVATLTAAIKEQQALIQTLQTQVAQLQAKVGI